MKQCKTCKETLPETEFYSAGNGYLRPECKLCKQKVELNAQRKRTRIYKEWKSTLKCERCGYDDWRALQFHHTNNDKEVNIASRCSTWSLKKVQEEASKCEVLCANCHQIEHYTPL